MSESELLERFHRTLIEEIQTQRPEYLTGPFTVAEIYQNLVPYGSHRDRIGVHINGDYEDALLRLLAGEGGYLVLESEPALRELRAELKTPNPNTGLYREFAAVDVRLNRTMLDFAAVEVEAVEPSRTAAAPIEVVPAAVDVFQDRAAAPSEETKRACQWCRAELPPRANINFCPFCGTDLKVVPCRECGEELEPSWRFCVACGTEVSG
jgi:hypothetical protein